MAEPQDIVVPLLREMRTEIRAGFERVARKLGEHDVRFDNLREAVNGESVLGRYAAAEVEERLAAIGKRLTALETSR
jgi:hypothetical protein